MSHAVGFFHLLRNAALVLSEARETTSYRDVADAISFAQKWIDNAEQLAHTMDQWDGTEGDIELTTGVSETVPDYEREAVIQQEEMQERAARGEFNVECKECIDNVLAFESPTTKRIKSGKLDRRVQRT
jgi:hypothetical protein